MARGLREHPGVLRVIIAGADGVPIVDDAVLEDRERAAASAAALAGIVDLAAAALGVDDSQGSVIYGRERQVITRSVGGDVLLVVLALAGEPGTGVYRSVRRAAAELEAAPVRAR
nr:roadblock/LC7 domain-containing protein [Demequina sp. NBRC 110056]